MTLVSPSADAGHAQPRERYIHGADAAEQRRLEQRTAATSAAFFTPHLRPGMRLLDVGCGPGSITFDLAALVAPGEVVGLDLQARQVARAQEAAAARGADNARFEVGDVYALPFPDASFDAAFAHAVLTHLADPVRALREMHRVLRPGGVVGVADTMGQTAVAEPMTPLMEEAFSLVPRILDHAKTKPPELRTRHLRRLAREAGFARVEAMAAPRGWGTPEATRRRGEDVALMLGQDGTGEVAIREGWVDRATLEAMQAEFRALGEQPDAVWIEVGMAIVGWKESEPPGRLSEARP